MSATSKLFERMLSRITGTENFAEALVRVERWGKSHKLLADARKQLGIEHPRIVVGEGRGTFAAPSQDVPATQPRDPSSTLPQNSAGDRDLVRPQIVDGGDGGGRVDTRSFDAEFARRRGESYDPDRGASLRSADEWHARGKR